MSRALTAFTTTLDGRASGLGMQPPLIGLPGCCAVDAAAAPATVVLQRARS